jgi:hypothetical protein
MLLIMMSPENWFRSLARHQRELVDQLWEQFSAKAEPRCCSKLMTCANCGDYSHHA